MTASAGTVAARGVPGAAQGGQGGEGSPYGDFLDRKRRVMPPVGFDVPAPAGGLFPFQRDLVRWALRRGRACLFTDTGTGKTRMQLAWAHHVAAETGGDVLILAPLAVAAQTVAEGAGVGIPVMLARDGADVRPGITITNYDRLHRFEPERFAGVVLDESSILKAQDGKTRSAIIGAFRDCRYRLACTATPAPNDHVELGNHAEFVGAMSMAEMLSTYFVHDGGETQKWRLKGHARADFWRWVCSWAALVRRPSDLGYEDGAYILPPLRIHERTVESEATEGYLFPIAAESLAERIVARRSSVDERVAEAAALVNADRDPWLVWCNLNAESSALSRAIPDAIEITGSDTPEVKERAAADFVAGKIRVLVSKPSIFGYGLNFQHCSRMAFVGLSDSWESYYQAVRRCWRFGQTRPVDVYVIAADIEGNVVDNIKRKDRDAAEMAEALAAECGAVVRAEVRGLERSFIDYRPTVPMEVPTWLTCAS
ncbi:MAG: helicase-related protein [Vicinamibacterales bacterium]